MTTKLESMIAELKRGTDYYPSQDAQLKLISALEKAIGAISCIRYQSQFWDLGSPREKLRLQLDLCLSEVNNFERDIEAILSEGV